ncbi:MAG: RNA polymerase sigma factor RpoH [Gammaproteobacteria bacterium]|nr:MAG: RNA polymerase sigma factor RpoH [Gammaproteobacteria bacterium]RLA12180.1 MAG: RNA polymerase sigma factor RpoH [Gammaproteobacteria bacterium]RLA14168.1 MAG: RNA polymerase sigma factor RpoH [Gammaproteobacteria bacterium]
MSQAMMTLAPTSDNLDHFIRTANSAPYLTKEQEFSLGHRLQKGNDIDAARQLVMSHLRYVIYVARGYKGYGLPLADLVQEGSIGLMKAAKKFDPSHGVRLVSFATHWIKAEIHEFVLRNWHIVKVATTKAQRKLFFNLRRRKQSLGWVNNQEADRIAEELGVSRADVLEMDARLNERPLAFDGYDDTDESSSPAAFLQAESSDPEAEVLEQDYQSKKAERLQQALHNLDERSQTIISSRWLSESKTGLQELGDRFGISAERVRQIESQAIKKLRGTLVSE